MTVAAINPPDRGAPQIALLRSREEPDAPDRTDALSAASSVGAKASSIAGDRSTAELEVLQISGQATTASRLLDEANSFIRSRFQKPFTAYDQGQVSPGGYINVKKFNDAIFDHAATVMTAKARDAGINLDKGDVAASLHNANAEISAIQFDDAQRVSALGKDSVFINLTAGDIDALTNAAVELSIEGADPGAVGTLAFDIGVARTFNGLKDAPTEPLQPLPTPRASSEVATATDTLTRTSSANLKRWGFSGAVADFFTARARSGDDRTLQLVNSLAARSDAADPPRD